MKKFAFLGLVLVLLAVSVMPVLAAGPNGHGNGASAGQGNGGGKQNRGLGNGNGRNKNNNPGLEGSGNQGSFRMRQPFYLQGTITNVGTNLITVQVHHGNARVKNFIGDTITVTVTTEGTDLTKIFRIVQGGENGETESEAPSENLPDEGTSGNRMPITFKDLLKNDIVAIHGNVVLVNSKITFKATLITVYVGTFAGLPETETP